MWVPVLPAGCGPEKLWTSILSFGVNCNFFSEEWQTKVLPSVTLTGGYDLKLKMEDFSYNPHLTLLGLRITFEKLNF